MNLTVRIRMLLLSLLIPLAMAGIKTGELKNVHLQDATQYVTDPFGIMSPVQKAQANNIIRQIWDRTSAEVLVVIVDESESGDANSTATEIFTDWGIGKKDKDNGVLLFIDNEAHEIVIRTGYGAEGALPDIIAGRIIRNEIIPAIREDGIGAGVIVGLQSIEKVLTDPKYAEELKSSIQNDAPEDDSWTATDIIGVSIFMLIALIGFGWFMYLVSKAQPSCPKCRKPMVQENPQLIMTYLTPSQQTEQRIGAKAYQAWKCPEDGTITVRSTPGPKAGQFTICPKCGAQAVETTPLYNNHGETRYERTYCHNCGDRHTRKRRDDAARALGATAAILGSFVSGRGGGGFGGFGGGSMGGGSTGGGGASGRW